MKSLPKKPNSDSNDDLSRSAENNVTSSNTQSNPNDVRILEVITKQGPLTRKQLMKATHIARSTIYDALIRLIILKKVKSFSGKPEGPGRPKVYFQIYNDDPSGNLAPMLVFS